MPAYGQEPETTGGRRQGMLAAAFLILALATSYLPAPAQARVAWTLRVSVLRPFVATQERLTAAALNASDVEVLMGQVDSLTSRLLRQGALVDENRTLRDLLELAERTGPSFLPATVLRPGTPGSESMFLIQVGSAEGVRAGAPVVNRNGLIGVILEVRDEISVGMDWTHPDFGASAMLEDGTMYGVVENRRGTFREADYLVLNGTAFNEEAPKGTKVVTSGLAGGYPRGIPIGLIDEVEDTQGQWRKSYRLRASVEPGSVTHVLVATQGGGDDVTALWAADSLTTGAEPIGDGRRP